jgi:hypothetical protein
MTIFMRSSKLSEITIYIVGSPDPLGQRITQHAGVLVEHGLQQLSTSSMHSPEVTTDPGSSHLVAARTGAPLV